MSLAQEFTAAIDSTFVQRVQMAGITFAVNIVQHEDPIATANHKNRAKYAQAFVATPALYAPNLAGGVIALNAAPDGSALTDTAINNSVATIWDMYAGIL